LFGCNLQQDFKIILFDSLVPTLLAAARTAEKDAVFTPFDLYIDGFHHTAAGFCPVAGVDVHVPAPQAYRAVVGVPAAFNLMAAVAADKIFYPALKFTAHGFLPFICCSS
jgi:hypothetical protein